MSAPSTTPVLDALNHAGVPKTDDDGPIGPALRIAVLACERDDARADRDRLHTLIESARHWWESYAHETDEEKLQGLIDACAYWHAAARDRVLRDAAEPASTPGKKEKPDA